MAVQYPQPGSIWRQKGCLVQHRILPCLGGETHDLEVITVTVDFLDPVARTFSWLGPLEEFQKQFTFFQPPPHN